MRFGCGTEGAGRKSCEMIMSWVQGNMTDDTRRSVNTFLGSRPGREGTKASRGLISIALFIVAGALVYISVPYAGAFVNVGKTVSVSKLDRSVSELAANLTQTSPVKKVYLRQGHGLKATYAVPKGTTVKLSIIKCESLPIIEVWSCTSLSKQEVEIVGTSGGERTFKASEAGFYYFRDEIIFGSTETSGYQLRWQRT